MSNLLTHKKSKKYYLFYDFLYTFPISGNIPRELSQNFVLGKVSISIRIDFFHNFSRLTECRIFFILPLFLCVWCERRVFNYVKNKKNCLKMHYRSDSPSDQTNCEQISIFKTNRNPNCFFQVEITSLKTNIRVHDTLYKKKKKKSCNYYVPEARPVWSPYDWTVDYRRRLKLIFNIVCFYSFDPKASSTEFIRDSRNPYALYGHIHILVQWRRRRSIKFRFGPRPFCVEECVFI